MSTGKRRKKALDLMAEAEEDMIALGIVSRIAEEFDDGVYCISDGELELWLVGGGAASCMEADDTEFFTVADEGELGMKPRQKGAPGVLFAKKVGANVTRFKPSRVNRGKLRLASTDSSNSHAKSTARLCKVEKPPRRTTKSAVVGSNRKTKR